MNLLLIVGLVALIFLSYLDIKTRRVSNWYILAFFLVGLIVRGILDHSYHNLIALALGIKIMAIVGFIMWKYDTIGGADAKLLPAMVPWLGFLGLPNTIINVLLFIIMFGLISLIYAFLYDSILKPKKKRHIPLLPAITLTFVINWYFRF